MAADNAHCENLVTFNNSTTNDILSINTEFLINENNELRKASEQCHELLISIATKFHISCLYKSQCEEAKEAYNNLTMLIHGVSNNYWKEFGRHLLIDNEKVDMMLDFIESTQVEVHKRCDIILKTKMQDDLATIDKIINTLVETEKPDIVARTTNNLLDLFLALTSNTCRMENNIGESLEKIQDIALDIDFGIITCFEMGLISDLPDILLEDLMFLNDGRKKIFLTYAEDGQSTVDNIKKLVNKPEFLNSSNGTQIDVVTLKDLKITNAKYFIKEHLNKFDIILPIITDGYIELITNKRRVNPKDPLDHRFVRDIKHEYEMFTESKPQVLFIVSNSFNKKPYKIVQTNVASINMPFTEDSFAKIGSFLQD